MSHARKQIRAAIGEILESGSGWNAVLHTRISPSRQMWPYLLVFSDGETGEQTTVHDPTVYERDLSVAVVAMLKVSVDRQTVEDQIDELCIEIETLLTTAALREKLPGKNLQLVLNGNTFSVVVDENDNVDHAEIVMAWTVKYYTQEGVPETLL